MRRFTLTPCHSGPDDPERGQPRATLELGETVVIETVGGPLIILGLFTRPVVFILAGEMAVAYFTAHMPKGLWPIMNGGERAVFYCWVYLFFAANGAGSFSLDGLWARRRSREAG